MFRAANIEQDKEMAIFYLNSVKEQETAKWLKTHPVEYKRILVEGMEIDNSQEEQLKELHRN